MLLIAFAALLVAAPSNVPDPLLPKPPSLAGEWQLLETADERRTDRGADLIRMTVSGANVTLSFGGITTSSGTVALGTKNGQQAIDVKMSNGLKLVGVYKLDGDALTICFDKSGRTRPANLTPVGPQWQEKWGRVKP